MTSPDGFELISRPGERRIIAGRDVWSVYEVPADRIGESPRDHTGCCLIFESVKVVRRVHDFPRNWRDLADAELAGVMERH
jgi:hypothetical protein